MAYFDSVHNDSTFRQKALSEGAQTLRSLLDTALPTSVSSWGRKHLFALRVLCAKPSSKGNLPLLEPYLPESIESFDPCIQALVDGPAHDLQALSMMSESQIVRSYNPNSLGSTWAALGALLRQRGNQDGNGQREDARCLTSCFVRLVLNYGQELDSPILEFRDEKASAMYQLEAGPRRTIQAIDDGGVRLLRSSEDAGIVALLEVKRYLQVFEEGKPPIISDGLLAQMAGQALLVLLDKTKNNLSRTSVITIHATRHYVRFFSFAPSAPGYTADIVALSPNDNGSDLFFLVNSTDWFDITTKGGREMIVRHILALIQWAHGEVENGSKKE
ncbi:uncharacterized protein B0H64DRAFT_428476 [Chaetomium fimeti]|uniref:Uncharacterized protein n=1 Tax=Chaetomium fimeti TaxID=1854472 RepID=A0AAE0HRD1_9PEZI|nr:hypothetical protein B0H64DRAFT_428476 [Chaetomium fimeti]